MGPFLAIFAIALAVRLFTGLHTAAFIDQQYETVRVALSFAHHGTLADPFRLPTGPTAHVAPAFPVVLGTVYKIFGAGLAGETAKRVLACCISSLGYALFPALARALSFAPATGIAAGLFGAVIPLNRYEETSGNSESAWAALILIVLVLAWRKPPPLFALGAACGLLFAPVLALVLSAWTFRRRQWLPLVVMPFLLFPWALRNSQKLHEWIWTRDNLGLELSLSNNDQATPTLRGNIRLGWHRAGHPSHSLLEADKVCYYGEPRYNRLRLHSALAWMETHRTRFAALTLSRIRWFWFPSLHFSFLVLLAFYGVWRTPSAPIFYSMWLLFPLLYYLIQYDPRYRYPIEWSLLLAAVNGVNHVRTLLLSDA